MSEVVRYTIQGHVPSKKNSKRIFYNQSRLKFVPSAAHETWYHDAAWQLKKQGLKCLENIEKIHLKFYAESKRANDLTNKAESVMDLLVSMDILVDDNWHIVPKVELEYSGIDKINPRVEIIIY